MVDDAIHFRQTLSSHLIQERAERMLGEPLGGLRARHHRWHMLWHQRQREVPKHTRFLQSCLAVGCNLKRKEPFMDHLAEAVYDTCAVEVQPAWGVAL